MSIEFKLKKAGRLKQTAGFCFFDRYLFIQR
jgi:hypothetical protein